jgi:hypothetical protein
VYRQNIQRLVELSATSNRSLEQHLEELRAAVSTATGVIDTLNFEPKTVNTSIGNLKVAVESVKPLMDEMITAIHSGRFVYSWMTVMLVTFAEAYLEDAFSLLISQGLGSSTLPDPLKEEIRKKWVKEALRSGRPHDWIKQLARFGITGYAPDQADKLLPIWQRRHTIVHTAAPEIPHTAAQQFLDATKLVTNFIEATDTQLLNISPSTQAT